MPVGSQSGESRSGLSWFKLELSLPNIALAAIVWMSFFNLVSLNVDKEDVGLDAQVLAKLAGLAVAGVVGAYGYLTSASLRKLCTSGWMLGISVFMGIYFVAAIAGYNRINSAVATGCLLASILVTTFSVSENGWYRTFYAAYLGLVLYCICSILYWLVAPDSAMFAEPLPEGQFAMRLRGLSHPNTLGQYSGMTVAVSIVLWVNRKIPTWAAAIALVMGLACLGGSLSRASMLATVFSLAFIYRKQVFSGRWIMPVLLGVAIVSFGIALFSEQLDLEGQFAQLLQKLSKSGDAEELTSATGRADIWAKTIELVSYRPLLGYGANTSKDLLIEYSQYTHNMYLNTALSGGVICMAITVWIAIGRFFQSFRMPNVYADLVLVFILISGMVENVIYAPLPAAMTIFWILALTSQSGVVRRERQRELPELN